MRSRTVTSIIVLLTLLAAGHAPAQGRGGPRGMRGQGAMAPQGLRWQAGNGYRAGGQTGRGGPGAGQGAGGYCLRLTTVGAVGQLTAEESETVLLLREEEKLARDVYQTLGNRWNVPAFKNIAQAELRHMTAMKLLVDRYGLVDPVRDDAVGVFSTPKFARLYEDLVKSGSTSLQEAYRVGVQIEELDIKDLKDSLVHVKSVDVRRVYQNLLRASENHLKAFSAPL